MNGLLIAATLVLVVIVALIPDYGGPALLVCFVPAFLVGLLMHSIKDDKEFLLRIFVVGLLVRMLVGTLIFFFDLHLFFGPDVEAFDRGGYALLQVWQGVLHQNTVLTQFSASAGWGMTYLVAAVYGLTGRNLLAVQFVIAVIGAATAPVVSRCAQHIFQNTRVAHVAAILVAFYPSLVLWSSMGLKDGPTVLLLTVAMLATLKLGDKLSAKYSVILVCALLGILSLRFYIFYMVVAAIAGAFVIGMRPFTTRSFLRQFVVIIGVGLAMTYLGVMRTANTQLERYGNLETIQRNRTYLAGAAQSGFGKDVDVSTTSGALAAIPLGVIYLLFAPFPWQLANLRQSITLPEMLVWWGAFPLLVLGIWFTVKYRLRQALPILIFTIMLTLAYSLYQGNVGTAYRQRAQLLIFYFIFVAVGFILLKEKAEDNKRVQSAMKQATFAPRASHKV